MDVEIVVQTSNVRRREAHYILPPPSWIGMDRPNVKKTHQIEGKHTWVFI